MAVGFPTLLANAEDSFMSYECSSDCSDELQQDYAKVRAEICSLEQQLGQIIGDECYYRQSTLGIVGLDLLQCDRRNLQDKLIAVEQDLVDTRHAHDDIARDLKQTRDGLCEQIRSHKSQCEQCSEVCTVLQAECEAASRACSAEESRVHDAQMAVFDFENLVFCCSDDSLTTEDLMQKHIIPVASAEAVQRLTEARQIVTEEENLEKESALALSKARVSYFEWDMVARAELVELERQLLKPIFKITQEIEIFQSETSRASERLTDMQRRASTWKGLFDQSVQRVEVGKLKAEQASQKCEESKNKTHEVQMVLEEKQRSLQSLEEEVAIAMQECMKARTSCHVASVLCAAVMVFMLLTANVVLFDEPGS